MANHYSVGCSEVRPWMAVVLMYPNPQAVVCAMSPVTGSCVFWKHTFILPLYAFLSGLFSSCSHTEHGLRTDRKATVFLTILTVEL